MADPTDTCARKTGEWSELPPQPIPAVDPKKENPATNTTSTSSAEKRRHTGLEKIGFFVATMAALGTGWQAYVANDTEKRQLRAYVFVDNKVQFFETNEGASVALEIKNFGNTPAYRVQYSIQGGIRPYFIDSKSFAPGPEWLRDAGAVQTLAPGRTSWDSIDIAFRNKSTKDGLHSPTMAFWVFGKIDYEDIFRRKCWTTFRFLVGGPQGFRGGQVATAHDGNDADRDCEPDKIGVATK